MKLQNIHPQVFHTQEGHIYFDASGQRYNSISRLVGCYHEPFEEEETSTYSAIKKKFPKELEKAKEKYKWYDPNLVCYIMDELLTAGQVNIVLEYSKQLVSNWGDSAQFGTDVHDAFENDDIKKGYKKFFLDGQTYRVINLGREISEYNNASIVSQICKEYRENIYIPEAIVAYPYYWYAGTIDKLWLYWTGSHFIAFVGDYKTDASGISKNAIFKQRGPQRFYGKLKYFQDSKFWYYTLKMSCYQYMLNFLGLEVRQMYLIHFPDHLDFSKQNFIPLSFYKNHAHYLLNKPLPTFPEN